MPDRSRAQGALLLLLALLLGPVAGLWPACGDAQSLYQYRDANGAPVFADRPPDAAQTYQPRELSTGTEAAEVRLYQRALDDGLVLVADNRYFGPVHIAFQLTAMDNLDDDTPRHGERLIAPRSSAELLVARRGDFSATMSFEYQFQYVPGDPGARHDPPGPYRLPYALAASFPVSQAFPDRVTHTEAASEHAVDFVMPIGTPVHAARDGFVIEATGEHSGSGLDPVADGPRANIVRILHDDGTMALYAHLDWNSVRVRPGQRIARGEHIADSGNTGFTSGPHLHFAVQRNRGGRIVTVPVQFAGPGARSVAVSAGDQPVAY